MGTGRCGVAARAGDAAYAGVLARCTELADLAGHEGEKLERALEERLRDRSVAAWVEALTKAGIRTKLDTRNEKITYKIREHALQKVPYFIVLGDKEKEAGKVAVRARGNQDLGVMELSALTELIAQASAERR